MGNPSIEPIVFTKPMHRDTAFTTNYVGGKYTKTKYLDFYDKLMDNNVGQVNFYQTYTLEYLNASYGAFAYLGNIEVADYLNNHPENLDYKNFYGFGATVDLQTNIPIGHLALRPLGGRFSVLYENGEYARYKNDRLALLGVMNNYIATTASQTFGVDYYFKKSSLGFTISAGTETTFTNLFFDYGFSANLIYTYDRFTVYLQQAGLMLSKNSDFVVGLTYRL